MAKKNIAREQKPPLASENRSEGISLSSSILKKLDQANDPFSVHCIYRIPDVLHKPNRNDFVPLLVSIGPFHHGKGNLQEMEKLKLWYLQCREPHLDMKCLVKAIQPIEEACRDCYGEKLDMTSDEFIEMMVIDGCFILEFLRRCVKPAGDEDFLFSTLWRRCAVIKDLLLLENQLPWRVLECLFDLTSKSGSAPLPLLILRTFQSDVGPLGKPSGRLKNRHLLDFIRNCLLGSYRESQSDENSPVSDFPFLSIVSDLNIPSVTQLRRAGVKFKFEKESENNILNINFKNGVMEIPPILVLPEYREFLFGNLIAYEKCQPDLGFQITSYVVVLDNLIKTSKDVEFLVKEGIVREQIQSKKELASFFTRVYNDTRLYNFSYVELEKEVNEFCSGGWKKCKMILRHDYDQVQAHRERLVAFFKNCWC